MADTPATTTASETPIQPPVVVKKYANRRLYNTETSSYITLDNLADMIRAGRDFVVYDAKSGDDITRGVLTQIIVEEESKGASMLPATFLRQLIGFYGGSLQGVVPRYLEQAMANFGRQQQQMRQVVQQTLTPFLPMGVEEIGRQNMAMMERAMSMFNPFMRPGESSPKAPETTHAGPAPQAPASAPSPAPAVEMDALRHEVESLKAQLAIARAEAAVMHVLPDGPVEPEAKAPETHALAAPHPVQAPNVLADPPPLPASRKTRPGNKNAASDHGKTRM